LHNLAKRNGARWLSLLLATVLLLQMYLPAMASVPPGRVYRWQFALARADWLALQENLSAGSTLTEQRGDALRTLPVWQRLFWLPVGAQVKLESHGSETRMLVAPPPRRPLAGNRAKTKILARAPWAMVEEVGYLRGYRLARLIVQPVSWDSARQMWAVARRVEVVLHLPAVTGASPTDVWGRTLARYAANGADLVAEQDRGPWPRQVPQPQLNPWAQTAGSLRLTIDHTGMYQVTAADLRAAGWDIAAIDPTRVQLWHGARQVAIWGVGQQDGRLANGDAFRFYAAPQPTRYQAADVYWLVVGQSAGLRVGTRDVAPIGTTVTSSSRDLFSWVQKKIYDSQLPGPDGDHWFSLDLRPLEFPPYPARTLAFALPGLVAWPHEGEVSVRFTGYTDSPHGVRIALNGHDLGKATWDGKTDELFTARFASSLLRVDGNQLVLRSADRGHPPDGVYLSSFQVGYRAVLSAQNGRLHWAGDAGQRLYQVQDGARDAACLWDVTDADAPQRLLHGALDTAHGWFRFADDRPPGTQYQLWPCDSYDRPAKIVLDTPSHLADSANQADYLLIAPRDFWPALLPLWQWREAAGLRVQMVDLQDVYDEFSFGRVDPEALRVFLTTAYHRWQAPVLRYVLLVGDGSYDFRDYYGWHPSNILPPYLADVDPWLGETASDNRLATVSGDDNIPDFFIGRLPVSNVAELRTVVDKIVRYEANRTPGVWQRRVSFIADNFRDAAGNEDEAGDFSAHAELSAGHQIPPAFAVQRLYYDPWPGTAGLPGHVADIDAFRDAVHRTWNEGSFIINYVGHSSYWQWMEENAFHLNDVPALHNGHRLPFLLAMTCFTGYFQHPEHPALDEALLTHAGGGTIGSWSSSGLAVASGHRFLQQGFYAALFNGETEIGPLTLGGELNLLAKTDQYAFLLDTYLVIGDPALELPAPTALRPSFLPAFIH